VADARLESTAATVLATASIIERFGLIAGELLEGDGFAPR